MMALLDKIPEFTIGCFNEYFPKIGFDYNHARDSLGYTRLVS